MGQRVRRQAPGHGDRMSAGTGGHTVTPADLQGNPWVFDHDFFLLVNVAVGGRFSERPDQSATFPQRMLVDYIRVYAA
jgi:beta-glucanase (GH16 family)